MSIEQVDLDAPARNEVLISLPEEHNERSLDTGRQQIVNALHTYYADNPFDDSGVKVDVVGPTVGRQLEKQAGLATLYSLPASLAAESNSFKILRTTVASQRFLKLIPSKFSPWLASFCVPNQVTGFGRTLSRAGSSGLSGLLIFPF